MTKRFETHRCGSAALRQSAESSSVGGRIIEPPVVERLAEWAADGIPIALVADQAVGAAELAAAEAAGGDCTLVITNPQHLTRGRGSADLAAVFWQTFPAVAALLGGAVLPAGGVFFHRGGLSKLDPERLDASDPVTSAVIQIALQGGVLKAVLVPGESDAALPSDPPRLVPAGPPTAPSWLIDAISQIDARSLCGGESNRADAAAIRAGLLLWHDELDASHSLSQSIEGRGTHHAGDYWHAIMHRREPDYGNAKYWFRRVGSHPVYESLAARCERLIGDATSEELRLTGRFATADKWNPTAFVDACAEYERREDSEPGLLLRRFQADEMLLLLWQTCLDAQK